MGTKCNSALSVSRDILHIRAIGITHCLKNLDSMNFLIIILNRVYVLLTKVKNQSPLFGAITLVTILIDFSLLNIVGFYSSFKIEPITVNIPVFIALSILTFVPLFFYSKKNESLITEKIIPSHKTNNLLVIILYLFTFVSTIYLANINRTKILGQAKKEQSIKPRKESLEGKIKKWFE